MTSIEELVNVQGLTDEILDQMAMSYENRDFELSGGTVYVGSHIGAVGEKKVTIVYPAADTCRVTALARTRGVRPSDIYHTALS